MKVTIVVNGRFHAFDYARELQSRGFLHRLVSSMPYRIAERFGIEQSKYVGLPILEAWKVLSRRTLRREPPAMAYAKVFGKLTEPKIPTDSDYIIGFNGYFLETLESKRLSHIPKVVDRIATHTLKNVELRRKADEYHKIPWIQYPPEKYIAREMREYELCDRILVPSTFVRETFLENGVPADKLTTIPYAFSASRLGGEFKRERGESPTILFVGNVSARKGIGVLVDSFDIVRKKIPDAQLVVVGPLNKKIPITLFERPGIQYRGKLGAEELKKIYLSANVFCLPTFEEGLALVLTEANAFGLPIVATRNSGIDDVTPNGNMHFLTIPGDADDLAKNLLAAIDFSQKQPATEVLNTASQPQTWSRYCDAMIETLKALPSKQ